MSLRLRADLSLLFNALIWGVTFPVVKSALGHVSPILFLACRFTLSAAAMVIFYWIANRRRPGGLRVPRGAWWAGALVGSLLFTGFVLQTIGLRFTSAPKSAFITGLCSVMVPLFASLVYRIRPQRSELAGIAMAIAGLGAMTLESVAGTFNPGDALTLACAAAFAAHIVVLGHYSGRMGFELLSVVQILAGMFYSLATFWWVETPRLEWQPSLLWVILITGLLATALAFTLQAWAQQHTTASRTALIYLLEPVFAWITSFWLTGEGLSARAAVGAFLILGGVSLVELKPFDRRPHPSG